MVRRCGSAPPSTPPAVARYAAPDSSRGVPAPRQARKVRHGTILAVTLPGGTVGDITGRNKGG
jgi:hypothetical protein